MSNLGWNLQDRVRHTWKHSFFHLVKDGFRLATFQKSWWRPCIKRQWSRREQHLRQVLASLNHELEESRSNIVHDLTIPSFLFSLSYLLISLWYDQSVINILNRYFLYWLRIENHAYPNSGIKELSSDCCVSVKRFDFCGSYRYTQLFCL